MRFKLLQSFPKLRGCLIETNKIVLQHKNTDLVLYFFTLWNNSQSEITVTGVAYQQIDCVVQVNAPEKACKWTFGFRFVLANKYRRGFPCLASKSNLDKATWQSTPQLAHTQLTDIQYTACAKHCFSLKGHQPKIMVTLNYDMSRCVCNPSKGDIDALFVFFKSLPCRLTQLKPVITLY